MAMTLASRRELYKLRELVHFLLVGRVCCFCKKPLSPNAEKFVMHGNSVGPKFEDKITVHHLDGNHDNDAHDNKAPCHTSCHKSYHRKQFHAMRKAAQPQGGVK